MVGNKMLTCIFERMSVLDVTRWKYSLIHCMSSNRTQGVFYVFMWIEEKNGGVFFRCITVSGDGQKQCVIDLSKVFNFPFVYRCFISFAGQINASQYGCFSSAKPMWLTGFGDVSLSYTVNCLLLKCLTRLSYPTQSKSCLILQRFTSLLDTRQKEIFHLVQNLHTLIGD